MTTHDALLAAVLANHADDLPRLVLADWLEEHGQSVKSVVLRMAGRYEIHPPLTVPERYSGWRLYWVVPGWAGVLLDDGLAHPVKCCDQECMTGWWRQVFFLSEWLCWACAAKKARKQAVSENKLGAAAV